MSYPDSVQYLYSLGNEIKAGAKLGLERIRTLLTALHSPERDQRFVHVAGTNGKGSTSAMIASALRQSGFRVGLYTSPHLVEPTERININGQPASREQFTRAFTTVHECAEKLLQAGQLDAHPSYFETVTAMAFLLFREHCDVSVIEVGLGGRLDATNVINPEVCAITSVAYDHEAFLGNTLPLIAAEKAGILKPNIPAIIAAQDPSAASVIETRAHELNCRLIRTQSMPISNLAAHAYRSSFNFAGQAFNCPLPGRHQIENAKTAILTCQTLGLPIESISAGIAKTKWPGRLELMSRHPDLILDGAHNPAGAAALAAYIREFHAQHEVWLVYGAMRDKAVEEVAEQLFPLAHKLIATAPDFPRALRPQAILDLARHPNAVASESVVAAINLALQAPPEAVVFFTGSLFLVGEARAMLEQRVS